MAKVFLICGRICCGKSVYARRLGTGKRAVVLSVDEIMLSVFGPYAGDRHDEYTERVQKYLFEKSLELVRAGIDVILDWGFWTRAKRAQAREFYRSRHIECELHYIDIDEETWKARIRKRNHSISAGETTAYLVDGGLSAKCGGLFEPPGEEEVDVRIRQSKC